MTGAGEKLGQISRTLGSVMTIFGAIAVAWSMIWGPVREEWDALKTFIVETRDGLESINSRLDGMEEVQVDLLRPTRVFEISPVSRPVAGYCVAGRACEFFLLAHRLPRGINCKLVAGETTYAFYGPTGVDRREVPLVADEGASRNVGLEWAEIYVTVMTPRDFVGQAHFVVIPLYDRCLGENDEVTVEQESALIPTTILIAEPGATTAPPQPEEEGQPRPTPPPPPDLAPPGDAP